MVTARSQRQARGQAMVETALGVLVFVTILVFGIHFAEVGYLSLKVTEASASAMWHATAAEMHTLPGDFGKLDSLISGSAPESEATNRYQDFDGRESKSGGSEVRQVFTQASGVEVQCDAYSIPFAPVSNLNSVYTDTGGMRCRAQATLSAWRFPFNFMDQGNSALFQKSHYDPIEITVCGSNRASGGSCGGHFAILLDDWGLATGQELELCPVLDGSGCANKPYYDSTNAVYQAYLPSGLDNSYQLATQAVGSTPGGYHAVNFYMSFQVYEDTENGGDADPGTWVTTPGTGSPTTEYDDSAGKRENCFLGLKCN